MKTRFNRSVPILFGTLIPLTVILACFLLPQWTNAERSIVFLRSTLPVESNIPDVLPQDNPADQQVQNDEEALIALLLRDDTEIAYQKMEDKERWQTVRMRVTGYCACSKCCGKHSDGVTASNHRIRWGDTFVAADKFYSFGTEMVVPGYSNDRVVTVQDRGRVIKGNRLDLYFNTHGQAKKWGVKYLDVLVKTD